MTSGLLVGRYKVLRSSRHTLQAQNQGHSTIDCLEEKGVEGEGAGRSSFVNQTNIEIVQRQRLETF